MITPTMESEYAERLLRLTDSADPQVQYLRGRAAWALALEITTLADLFLDWAEELVANGR